MASASDERHGVGDDLGARRAARRPGTSAWCSAASDTAPSSTEHTVMPSWRGGEQQAGALQRLAAPPRRRLLPCVGERLELAAAGRHRGELGADEEGVGAEQHERDEDDGPARSRLAPPPASARSSRHRRSSPARRAAGRRARGAPGRRGGRPCRRPGPSSRRPRTVSPTAGTRPEGRHDPAADGLVGRPVGDGDAHPGAHLVGAPQARARSTTRRAAGGRWSASGRARR